MQIFLEHRYRNGVSNTNRPIVKTNSVESTQLDYTDIEIVVLQLINYVVTRA